MSADISTQQDYAVSERSIIKAVTRRISGAEEKILGPAFMGGGVFLQDSGSSNGRDDKAIY